MKPFATACFGLLAVLTCGAPAMADQPASAIGRVTDVERVADALLEGHRAAEGKDGATLGRSALLLAGLGARPLDDDAEKLDESWKTMARNHGFADDSQPLRGRALGPAYRRGILAGGEMHVTDQLFFAGKHAEIAVVPASGANFLLTVKDAKGKEICSKHVSEPRASCQWSPYFTDRYSIIVTNRGQTRKVYYLVVN